MPSYSQTITRGLAQLLDEQDLASYDFAGAGDPYTVATEWPIYIGKALPTSPHQLVNLSPGVQSFDRADVMTQIQIRLRSAVADPDNAGAAETAMLERHQAILDFLYPQGLPRTHFQMGAVRVGAVFPGDTLPVDADPARRVGIIQNFRFRTRRIG